MKIILYCSALALLLSACEGWPLTTLPYNPPTLVPSRTPSVLTATPVLSPVPPTTAVPTSTGTAVVESPTAPLVEVTPSETLTPTLPPAGSVSVDILGCDTSIDLVHGMGEVTNAYVTITNTTAADVPDLCATLNALDEGRPHPDKTKCLSLLPAGHQVTLKLTVDSTFRENTPVQVDIASGETLLQRAGEAACTAIGVLPPDIDTLGTPQPVP